MGVPELTEELLEKLQRSGVFFFFWHPVWLDLLDNVTNAVILYVFMSLNIPV